MMKAKFNIGDLVKSTVIKSRSCYGVVVLCSDYKPKKYPVLARSYRVHWTDGDKSEEWGNTIKLMAIGKPINEAQFKKGDLIKHSSYLDGFEHLYGIVVETMPINYNKIKNIKCLWPDNSETWVNKNQIVLVARGQNGTKS